MFTLLETIIAFTVIMMLLSFLVKSLTEVVKNHFDYYSGHLESEVHRLVVRLLGGKGEDLEAMEVTAKDKTFKPFAGIDWKRVGEEFLTAENLKALLGELLTAEQLATLKGQVAIHKGKLDYLFARRMKNLSLVCGLALCLLVNINAFTIWQTLYEDGQTRAKFAEPDYVAAVLERAGGSEDADGAGAPADDDDDPAGDQAVALAAEREMFRQELESFTTDVDFGVGRVYDTTVPLGPRGLLDELVGSLLTGVLVSIGAPHWHDLLSTLNRVRPSKA